jgi:two-component system cell cycle sensor histidine kinase/response regulator CckA
MERAAQPPKRMHTQSFGLKTGVAPSATLDSRGRIAGTNAAWRREAAEHPLIGARAVPGSDYGAICETAPDCAREAGLSLAGGIRQVLQGRVDPFQEERRIRVEGREILVRATVQPISGGPACAALVTLENATQEIQQQEQLRESARMLRAIFNRSTDIFTAQNPQGRLLLINPAGAAALGRAPEMLLGRSPTEVFGPEFGREIEARLRLVAASREPQAFELRWKQEGRERSIQSTLMPYLSEDGELRGIVGISRDVTKERGLEDQLRQSQKMEAIGRLAAGIAHDFNNILMAIGGYTDLVAAALPPDSRLREDVAEIRQAVDRASSLTRQLLAFGRRQLLAAEVIDLDDLVRRFEPMLRRVISEDIEVVLDLRLPEGRVKADQNQLDQVLMNLAVNARDAMPQGGRLTIRTSRIEAPDEFERTRLGLGLESYAVLEVSDTGVGMDEKALSHLFEPFYTTKETGKGTGLGLAMVYGIIHQSGGRLAVQSAPGCGTTFRIYLPETTEKSPARRSITVPLKPGRGEGTILVVEDAGNVRGLLQRVLEEGGYEVVSAANGEEAVAVARAQSFDILLTDVVMPKMDGSEVARRVLEIQPAVKVIYMTGYTTSGVVRRHVLDSSVPVLQKPFKPRDLLAKIQEVQASGGGPQGSEGGLRK